MVCLALAALLTAAACAPTAPSQPEGSSTAPSAATSLDAAATTTVWSSASSPTASVTSTGTVRVRIVPKVTVHNGVLSLTGTTSLIDGAVIHWEVGRAKPNDQWVVDRSGDAVVQGGRFSLRTNVRSVPGKTLYAYLLFTTYGQPEAVRALYGETGGHMRNDHDVMRGDYRRLEYWVKARR